MDLNKYTNISIIKVDTPLTSSLYKNLLKLTIINLYKFGCMLENNINVEYYDDDGDVKLLLKIF